MNLIARHVRPGKLGLAHAALRYGLRSWLRLRTRGAPAYRPPSEAELAAIEAELRGLGIGCEDLCLDQREFEAFSARIPFPADYHGGTDGGVYREKLLEHFVAWKLLGLDAPGAGCYVDIAACASPWAKLLHERGIDAHAIDLELAEAFRALPFYRQEDATRTSFADASVRGASLQCAYEMFAGDSDQALLTELARILEPGGRAIISPLYMHTHACYYQTPEHYGRAGGDPGATAYVRRDCWGIRASRKYSAATLRERVWDVAVRAGLRPRLLVLRNKRSFGADIYLHFMLELAKPAVAGAPPGETP